MGYVVRLSVSSSDDYRANTVILRRKGPTSRKHGFCRVLSSAFDFRHRLGSRLPRNHGKNDPRGLLGAVVNAYMPYAHPGRSDLRLSRLQVSRKMREKRPRQLHPYTMSLSKNVRRKQPVELEPIDFSGLKELRGLRHIAVARTQHIEPRAHQVVRGALWRNIQNTHPQIKIRHVCRNVHFRPDRA